MWPEWIVQPSCVSFSERFRSNAQQAPSVAESTDDGPGTQCRLRQSSTRSRRDGVKRHSEAVGLQRTRGPQSLRRRVSPAR